MTDLANHTTYYDNTKSNLPSSLNNLRESCKKLDEERRKTEEFSVILRKLCRYG